MKDLQIALIAESIDRAISIYELADQTFSIQRDNGPATIHNSLKDAIDSLPSVIFRSVSLSERINRFYGHSIKTNQRIIKVLDFEGETCLCNIDQLCLSDLGSFKAVGHFWGNYFQRLDKATLKEMILVRYQDVLLSSGKK